MRHFRAIAQDLAALLSLSSVEQEAATVSRQMEEGKGRNFGQEETSQNLVTAAQEKTKQNNISQEIRK